MAEYRYLTNGNDDGTIIGKTSSEPLGFFGATPVTRQSLTYTTFATTGIVTGGVFSTSTLSIAFVNAVSELLELCANLGLGA